MNKDEFLAEFEDEDRKLGGDDDLDSAFGEEQEEDTSPDSPSGEQPEEDETDSSPEEEVQEEEPEEEPQPEEDEEDLDEEPEEETPPFHQHPRWQEIYGELQDLREFKEEVQENPEKVLSVGETPTDEPEEAPEWFKDIFGHDDDTWKKYREYDKKQRKQIKQEVIQDIKKQQQEAQKQQEKYDKWVKSEVSRLKSQHGDFDKNRLMKVALDYKPTDEEGNIDLDKAYDIMTKMKSSKPKKKKKKKTTDKKKDIAAKTMDDTKGEGEKKDYMTPDDLKNKTMHELLDE